MRILNRFQKWMLFLLTCSMLWTFSGCNRTQQHQSPQEKALGYFWYEAVFLDKEEVENVFRMASNKYPEYNVPGNYHVTTDYMTDSMPEPKNENLYGTPVTVHIIGYASGPVQDLEEDITSYNEGLLVELSSTDERMQDLIDSRDKIWHITGSYSVAAKYTEQLDFSDATPLDITIEGVFGKADHEGNIILDTGMNMLTTSGQSTSSPEE